MFMVKFEKRKERGSLPFLDLEMCLFIILMVMFNTHEKNHDDSMSVFLVMVISMFLFNG